MVPEGDRPIGKMHRTLESRAIKIELRRKGLNERVESLPDGNSEVFDRLRRQCVRWAQDNAARLTGARPDLPVELNNRAADNWRPLVAIADAVGGKWSKLARDAAKKLNAKNKDDSWGVTLLRDLFHLFEATERKNLASVDIIEQLVKMEDRVWPEMPPNNKPLTPTRMSNLLRPFDIGPKSVHLGHNNKASGYARDQFADAWERYLLPEDKIIQEQPEAADVPKKDEPETTARRRTNSDGRFHYRKSERETMRENLKERIKPRGA
jgi:hypothetical protein